MDHKPLDIQILPKDLHTRARAEVGKYFKEQESALYKRVMQVGLFLEDFSQAFISLATAQVMAESFHLSFMRYCGRGESLSVYEDYLEIMVDTDKILGKKAGNPAWMEHLSSHEQIKTRRKDLLFLCGALTKKITKRYDQDLEVYTRAWNVPPTTISESCTLEAPDPTPFRESSDPTEIPIELDRYLESLER